MKAAEAKRIEKERTEKYQKLKEEAKEGRAKYREKVGAPVITTEQRGSEGDL